jgi:ribosomal protein S2
MFKIYFSFKKFFIINAFLGHLKNFNIYNNFIIGFRNNLAIIDLEYTFFHLRLAL